MTNRNHGEIPAGINPEIPALGIRQPWIELILQGKKTIELRRSNTHTRGVIYLYASRKNDTTVYANRATQKHQLDLDKLPHGLLIGSVEIVECRPSKKADAPRACVTAEKLNGYNAWCLKNPVRFAEPVEVKYLPYGTWFYPYQRVGK